MGDAVGRSSGGAGARGRGGGGRMGLAWIKGVATCGRFAILSSPRGAPGLLARRTRRPGVRARERGTAGERGPTAGGDAWGAGRSSCADDVGLAG